MSTVESFTPLLTPEERAALVRNLADGPLRWVSREYADFPSIRFDKANEIMGRLEPLIESMLAARQEGKQ